MSVVLFLFARRFSECHWDRTSARGEGKGAGDGRADNGAFDERRGGAAEKHGDGGAVIALR